MIDMEHRRDASRAPQPLRRRWLSARSTYIPLLFKHALIVFLADSIILSVVLATLVFCGGLVQWITCFAIRAKAGLAICHSTPRSRTAFRADFCHSHYFPCMHRSTAHPS